MAKMLYAAVLSATALLGAVGAASAQPAYAQPSMAPTEAAQLPMVEAETTEPPHYEWQYHYAGHSHPEFQGYWALVQ
jgi:hypothetical protein